MSSVVRKDWSHEFPSEVLLMILADVVTLPKGINGLRWFAMSKMKLEPLLRIRGFVPLFEELFYSKNKLALFFAPRLHLNPKPSPLTELRGGKKIYLHTPTPLEPSIMYPPPRVNFFVRRLELHLVIDSRDDRKRTQYDTNRIIGFQLIWLRDMAAGMKGFKRLEELTLCFDSRRQDSEALSGIDPNNVLDEIHGDISEFCQWLKGEMDYPNSITRVAIERPILIKFPVVKLDFMICGHSCESDTCDHSPGVCDKVKHLRKHFVN